MDIGLVKDITIVIMATMTTLIAIVLWVSRANLKEWRRLRSEQKRYEKEMRNKYQPDELGDAQIMALALSRGQVGIQELCVLATEGVKWRAALFRGEGIDLDEAVSMGMRVLRSDLSRGGKGPE